MKTYLTLKDLREMKPRPIDPRRFRKRFRDGKARIGDALRWIRFLRKPEWEAGLLAQTPELTEAMIAAGANVDACNGYAFFLAGTENRPEVLTLLKERKERIEQKKTE